MKDLSNENIIHIKKEGIEYLQFKKLLEYSDKINHAYCVGTDRNFITEKAVNQEPSKPELCSEKYKETDGLITNKPKTMLATTNANCILLLFYDPIKNVIANTHSGWKANTFIQSRRRKLRFNNSNNRNKGLKLKTKFDILYSN